MQIYDISSPLSKETSTYKGDPAFRLRFISQIEKGSSFSLSSIFMASHTGTHVDAPSHFISGSPTVENLSLQLLIGPAYVYTADSMTVDHIALDSSHVPPDTKRLLIKTNMKKTRSDPKIGLTLDGAQWLLENGVQLVGIDQLSIEPDNHNNYIVHKTLLNAGVIIVEGLILSHVPEGEYELYCLPLKVVGAEGAPARAILVDPKSKHRLS